MRSFGLPVRARRGAELNRTVPRLSCEPEPPWCTRGWQAASPQSTVSATIRRDSRD